MDGLLNEAEVRVESEMELYMDQEDTSLSGNDSSNRARHRRLDRGSIYSGEMARIFLCLLVDPWHREGFRDWRGFH